MRGSKVLVMVLALVTFAVGPTVALAASQPSWNSGKSGMLDYRSTEGKVAALDLTAKTIQIMPTDGSMPGPVRVAIGDQTVIRQGMLHRTLANLKIGEDVNLRYSGSGNTWVADSINILDSSVPVAQYLGRGGPSSSREQAYATVSIVIDIGYNLQRETCDELIDPIPTG